MVASFIKLLITRRTAIKSTYILENSLVRHVHIYDGILNDVNISATKRFGRSENSNFSGQACPRTPLLNYVPKSNSTPAIVVSLQSTAGT